MITKNIDIFVMSFNEQVGEVSFTEFKYNNKLVAWLVAIYVALDNTRMFQRVMISVCRFLRLFEAVNTFTHNSKNIQYFIIL